MRTEYTSVRFCYPARVKPGKPSVEIDARGSIKLYRITEGGRDTLHVVGSGLADAPEIPWSNVASASRAPEAKGKKSE